jgi:hypothetical protein
MAREPSLALRDTSKRRARRARRAAAHKAELGRKILENKE